MDGSTTLKKTINDPYYFCVENAICVYNVDLEYVIINQIDKINNKCNIKYIKSAKRRFNVPLSSIKNLCSNNGIYDAKFDYKNIQIVFGRGLGMIAKLIGIDGNEAIIQMISMDEVSIISTAYIVHIDHNRYHNWPSGSVDVYNATYIPSFSKIITFYYDNIAKKSKILVADVSKNKKIVWVDTEELISNEVDFSNLIHTVNVFSHLILVSFYDKTFMFLDLHTSQWFKCGICAKEKPCYIVNNMNNFISITAYQASSKVYFNFKMSLLDMIPFELDYLYRNDKYNKLVFGFISQQDLPYNFPIYLKKLVLKYFPCFLYL